MFKLIAMTAVALLAATFLAGVALAERGVDFVRWQGGDGHWTYDWEGPKDSNGYPTTYTNNWEAWGDNIGGTMENPAKVDRTWEDVLWNYHGSRGYINYNRPDPGLPPYAGLPEDPNDNRGGETIIIDNGTVDFNATEAAGGPLGNDFMVFRGSDLVIRDGAVWRQTTLPTWGGNAWTKIDADNFILDGGTFVREGTAAPPATELSGGALAFGLRGGDDDYEPDLGPQVMNIELKNGGRIENEGQLWFGYWAERGLPVDLDDHNYAFTITMTINDGSLDLTGGEIPVEPPDDPNDPNTGQPANGDLMFAYMYSDGYKPARTPTYSINFTGPGTITVDEAGIRTIVRADFYSYTNLEPQSYQDLWDDGILQANGLSGLDPNEDFNDYFTVTNNVGDENYTLTSLLTGLIPGDVNGDGKVDEDDVPAFLEVLLSGPYNEAADMNDDQQVNGLDVAPFRALFAAAGAQAIPEPSTLALALVALVGLAWSARRRG